MAKADVTKHSENIAFRKKYRNFLWENFDFICENIVLNENFASFFLFFMHIMFNSLSTTFASSLNLWKNFPFFKVMISSAYTLELSMSCETQITNVDFDRILSILKTIFELTESNEPVGSSQNKIFGEWIIARAIATLCFSPPLIFLTKEFLISFKSNRLMISSILLFLYSSSSEQSESKFILILFKTVSSSSKLKLWNTNPNSCNLKSLDSLSLNFLKFFASKNMSPSYEESKPESIFKSVDFPHPLSPTKI